MFRILTSRLHIPLTQYKHPDMVWELINVSWNVEGSKTISQNSYKARLSINRIKLNKNEDGIYDTFNTSFELRFRPHLLGYHRGRCEKHPSILETTYPRNGPRNPHTSPIILSEIRSACVVRCRWRLPGIGCRPGEGTPILGHGREISWWWPTFWRFSIWLGQSLFYTFSWSCCRKKNQFVSISFSSRDT